MVRAKEHMVVRDGTVDRSRSFEAPSHDFDHSAARKQRIASLSDIDDVAPQVKLPKWLDLLWMLKRAHDAVPGLIVTSWVEGR